MRQKDKSSLLAKMMNGTVRCDCGASATRIDEAGRPECQRCHDLNELAQWFHERTFDQVRREMA